MQHVVLGDVAQPLVDVLVVLGLHLSEGARPFDDGLVLPVVVGGLCGEVDVDLIGHTPVALDQLVELQRHGTGLRVAVHRELGREQKLVCAVERLLHGAPHILAADEEVERPAAAQDPPAPELDRAVQARGFGEVGDLRSGVDGGAALLDGQERIADGQAFEELAL